MRVTMVMIGAVTVAAAILAGLGYVSLRHWETAAELRFREQARDMTSMAAEKVEMTVLKAEEEMLSRLQVILLEATFSPEQIDGWIATTPLVSRVHILDRGGALRYPVDAAAADPQLVAQMLAEVPPGFWQRGGRRHVRRDDHVVLVAVCETPSGPMLVAAARSEDVLRREVLEKTLGALEGPNVLAVIDAADRTVYAPRPLQGAQPVALAAFGEALPAWRVGLFQVGASSVREAVRRQAMIFMGAFVLLLVVIAFGLAATFRLVRRESEMARLKSDLVANVSHDLKTPLSLIRMFGETLEMNRVSDETTRREYYAVITRESERLTRLIDNVLDFSRIESGRQRYDIAPAPVEPVLLEVLDAFRFPLAQKGFKLEVDINPDLPEVAMDPGAVGQAVTNLIDNAIKYSSDRRSLHLRAWREGDEVAIAVSDDGIGIPPGETKRIFDKFYRVGRSDTQGRRGSGVGLTLVKHIVDAHRGRVTVESRLGEGSRFTIRLPVAA